MMRSARPAPETPTPPKPQTGRRLGQILIGERKINAAQLDECLGSQTALSVKGEVEIPLLGHLLVHRGYASRQDVQRALDLQYAMGRRCGSCGAHCPAILLDMEDTDRCPACGEAFESQAKGAAAGPAPEPAPPELRTLGKYRLLRRLGRGSMGSVYHALDTTLSRNVALKLMHEPPPGAEPGSLHDPAQFAKEAMLCANLPKHPNIVTVYEAGVLENRPFIAMELLDGVPLTLKPPRGALAIRQQARILRDVALAVHHAHEHGVLHCDLKPSNVIVDDGGRPYVTDFGLARPAGAGGGSLLAGPGYTAGTPGYMSPEQARAVKLDRRTDIYSLGVMLYQILTGRLPFRARTAEEYLQKTVNDHVPPPSAFAAGVLRPNALAGADALCLRALARKPEDRFPTAKAFADELAAWLKAETPRTRLPRKPRSRSSAWIAAGACLALVPLIALLWPARPSPREPLNAAAPPDPDRVRAAREEGAAAARREERERALLELEKSRAAQERVNARGGRRDPLEWLLAAPFQNRGVDARHPPELGIDLNADMPGKAGPVRWKLQAAELVAVGTAKAALFDLAALCQPNTLAEAYVLIHVKSPAATEARLLLGSDDGVKVWLNGEPIFAHEVGRGVHIDEDKVPMALKPGWNRLMIRVHQGGGGWGLAARITDAALRPIDGLEYDAYGDLSRPAQGSRLAK
jgi:eukaryotic-like serine/threonine-protein kinase